MRAIAFLILTMPAFAQIVNNYRGGDNPVAYAPGWNYAPTIMLDGTYRMWWCGAGPGGDNILYAESNNLDGPWHSHTSSVPGTYDTALSQNPDSAAFDHTHVCDPSVVRVNGIYYMYYGGNNELPPPDNRPTKIGVAQSMDGGYTWTKLNNGNAIIVPARDLSLVPAKYGAGQPSVIWLNGLFYVIYTDTTGYAGDGNGGGQYVLRSSDPTFQTNVEELGSGGSFLPEASNIHTQFKLMNTFSVDWQFNDTYNIFTIASSSGASMNTVDVSFFDINLHPAPNPQTITTSASWTEGFGIVSRPDKHAVASNSCGVVPIDLMRPVGNASSAITFKLAHNGYDILTGLDCSQISLGKVYEGYLLQVSGLPIAFVAGGQRLQLQSLAVATRLSRNAAFVTSDMFFSVPFAASLLIGADAIGAPARPAAFVLDGGTWWGVSCFGLLSDNSSVVNYISQSQFDGIPFSGKGLYCLY